MNQNNSIIIDFNVEEKCPVCNMTYVRDFTTKRLFCLKCEKRFKCNECGNIIKAQKEPFKCKNCLTYGSYRRVDDDT